jgi:predicted amino acid dehydrogenase
MATKKFSNLEFVPQWRYAEHSLDIDWKNHANCQYGRVPDVSYFACFAESMLLEFENGTLTFQTESDL